MASDRQVSANRQNAAKSTGPITQNGKLQSRRNAIRHGLTAATVVPAIEDPEEFERFEAAVRADYQPASTVEHELVARLTSLLWRLRRSTLIETNLFKLQARLAKDKKLEAEISLDAGRPGMGVFYRLQSSPEKVDPHEAAPMTSEPTMPEVITPDPKTATSIYPNPATIFFRLFNLHNSPHQRDAPRTC